MTKHQTVSEILSVENFYDEAVSQLPEEVGKFVEHTSWAAELRKKKAEELQRQSLQALVTEMVEEIIGIPNYETYEQNVIAQFQHEIRQHAKAEIERRFL